MAKRSSVQIAAQFDGDGVAGRFEPPAMINSAAPAAGPIGLTLAVASWTGVTPPAGAKGVIISPGSAPDFKLANYVGDGNGIPLTPTESHVLRFRDPSTWFTANTLIFFSTAGGTIVLTWC